MAALSLSRATGRTVAFVSEGRESEVNRLVDEELLPKKFVVMATTHREYDLVGAAVTVCFNRKYKDYLTKVARRSAIQAWAKHYSVSAAKVAAFFNATQESDDIFDSAIIRALGHLAVGPISVDLSEELAEIGARIKLLGVVEDTVISDPEVMGGVPVFKGTRLPVETVLASLDAGVPLEELIEDYPYLTEKMIERARVYVSLHPRRGRPRKPKVRDGLSIVRHEVIPAARG